MVSRVRKCSDPSTGGFMRARAWRGSEWVQAGADARGGPEMRFKPFGLWEVGAKAMVQKQA